MIDREGASTGAFLAAVAVYVVSVVIGWAAVGVLVARWAAS
jgi:hypothetical protein